MGSPAGVIVVSAYVAAQMMANITSLKIITLFSLSMDAGTLIYPFTFTLRDLVHKTLGVKAARVVIVTAAAINLAMAALFWLVTKIPGDPSAGSWEAFDKVLAPTWRIVIASIVAQIVAELIDTEAYALWVRRVGHRIQWARVLVSNAISVPIDSLLFSFIAFAGTMALANVWQIVASNILLKGATTLLSLPLIYTVKEKELSAP